MIVTLTVSRHADREAFLEATVLAPVAVHAHDEAVLVLHAHLVVDVLLNAATEETLQHRGRGHGQVGPHAHPFGKH